MTEVISEVDSVFASPEFDEVLKTRIEAIYQLRINEDKLADGLRRVHQSPDRSETEVDYLVSGYLETSPETFDEIYGSNSDIAIFSSLRAKAQSSVDKLDITLLETAEQKGMGQFALFGLYRQTHHGSLVERPILKEAVKATEQELLTLEAYINGNSGRLLTCITALGVYGARLAHGDITIENKRSIQIPTVEEQPVYAMSFIPTSLEVYEQKALRIDASDVLDGNATYHDNWVSLLDLSEGHIFGGATFAVGDMDEGPLYLSGDDQRRNAEFYQTILERIRQVGRLAGSTTVGNR